MEFPRCFAVLIPTAMTTFSILQMVFGGRETQAVWHQGTGTTRDLSRNREQWQVHRPWVLTLALPFLKVKGQGRIFTATLVVTLTTEAN